MGFIVERFKSVVSKKLGAALGAEAVIASTNPAFTGVPLIVYIVVQGLLDGWRYWVDAENGK